MNKFKNIKFSCFLLLVFSCFSFNFLLTEPISPDENNELKKITIDLKPFSTNIKLTNKELNDKEGLDNFFNKYMVIYDNCMTISEYFSQGLNKGHLKINTNLYDLFNFINNDERISNEGKELNIKILKKYYLDDNIKILLKNSSNDSEFDNF